MARNKKNQKEVEVEETLDVALTQIAATPRQVTEQYTLEPMQPPVIIGPDFLTFPAEVTFMVQQDQDTFGAMVRMLIRIADGQTQKLASAYSIEDVTDAHALGVKVDSLLAFKVQRGRYSAVSDPVLLKQIDQDFIFDFVRFKNELESHGVHLRREFSTGEVLSALHESWKKFAVEVDCEVNNEG